MSDEQRETTPPRRSSPVAWVLLVLVLLAAGAGLYLLQQKQQASLSELATERARVAEVQRKLDAENATNVSLRDALTKLNDENAILNIDRQELSRDVAEKNDQLAKLKGTYDELQDKMKAEIAKGDIQLSEAGGKLRVDLVDKILFDSGEAQISSRGEEVLQRVGAVLASIDDKQIQVSGHTDDQVIMPKLMSQFPTNWELSSARAINVVRFLNEKAKIPGKRLVASAYGPYHPIATNSTPVGRARNRRIEILLTPLMESVPNKKAVAVAPQPAPVQAVAPASRPAPQHAKGKRKSIARK